MLGFLVFGGFDAETDADKKEALAQGGRKKQVPQVNKNSLFPDMLEKLIVAPSKAAADFGEHGYHIGCRGSPSY